MTLFLNFEKFPLKCNKLWTHLIFRAVRRGILFSICMLLLSVPRHVLLTDMNEDVVEIRLWLQGLSHDFLLISVHSQRSVCNAGFPIFFFSNFISKDFLRTFQDHIYPL